MPRFGIKAQFTLLSLGLISIPLAGLSYWEEIQKTALTAQARIQEIEAKAIATSLLATQQNIGELLAVDEDSELNKHALSAPAVRSPLRLDATFNDWPREFNKAPRFNYDHPVWLADSEADNEAAFSLRLAQSPKFLYVGLEVRDNLVVKRKASHLRLDYNDHVRLSYIDETQTLRRILIPAEREGAMASYYTDQEWQFGRDIVLQESENSTPSHRTNIQGYWRQTPEGYALEFRMPTDQLGTVQPQIRFAVVDVDENPAFGPQAIVASIPTDFEDQLNPVGLHAQELQRVIDQLKTTYARLWIYDSQGREWAFAERDPALELAPTTFDSQCVKDAIQGQIRPIHQINGEDGKLARLVVCYPIIQEGKTLGAVVIDESVDHVLAKEQSRVFDIAVKLGIAIAALVFALFAYAFNLVRRISRLSDEARTSVDPYGRIETIKINASKNFPDEVGDLSRSLSTLLQKQHSYVTFLERMPQTLRHEIANPLNKLRTSIENLLDQQPELADDRYIQKIDAGIEQITRITMHLTEAASIESALQEETLSELDLCHFLKGYCSNWEGDVLITMEEQEGALINGDASRLEQLFDKLLDNALSFKSGPDPVSISVKKVGANLVIEIENKGPLLPTENSVELFSPMLSTSSSGSSIHLGLGLHIAKLICDQHKAVLNGRNNEDGSGVIFSVRFPLL